MGAQIALIVDKESEYERFKIDIYGLCLKFGSQIASGLYCDEFYDEETMYEVEGELVCHNCLEDHYTQCQRCGDRHDSCSVYTAVDSDGNEVLICDNVETATKSATNEEGTFV